MKSRILKTVGLIAAMVSCIGMTAFAAPSPAASTVVTAVSSATDADGNAVNVSITSEIPYSSSVFFSRSATFLYLESVTALTGSSSHKKLIASSEDTYPPFLSTKSASSSFDFLLRKKKIQID